MERDRLQLAFGKVVRSQRDANGVSQEALADLAGLHRTYVSLLERGERNPSLKVIAALAKALGTSCATLVTRAEDEERRRR